MKLESFREIILALNDAGVIYLVVGWIAVAAHGYGRLTIDVDLVVKLEKDDILGCFDALNTLGYQPRLRITADQFADESQRRQWIE